MKVLILNGPNLNLLGTREPHLYGTQTLSDIIQRLQREFVSAEITHLQSNHEGALVDAVQTWRAYEGLIINAGAYSHTSIALLDALRSAELPKVEVHLSNIYAREEFRRHSYVSEACNGVIAGLGAKGYSLALRWLLEKHSSAEPK